MMRWVFSLIGLLLVVYMVLEIGKRQLQAVAPPAPAPGASAAATLPQQVQQDVQKALEQGMQQRASEASR